MTTSGGTDDLGSNALAQQHLKSLVGLNSSVTKKCRAALQELTAVHQRFEHKQQEAPSLERCESVAARLTSQQDGILNLPGAASTARFGLLPARAQTPRRFKLPAAPGEYRADSMRKLDKASEKFEALQSELLSSRQRLEQCEQATASRVAQLQSEAATSRSLGLRAMENVAQELEATQYQLAGPSFMPAKAAFGTATSLPGVDDGFAASFPDGAVTPAIQGGYTADAQPSQLLNHIEQDRQRTTPSVQPVSCADAFDWPLPKAAGRTDFHEIASLIRRSTTGPLHAMHEQSAGDVPTSQKQQLQMHLPASTLPGPLSPQAPTSLGHVDQLAKGTHEDAQATPLPSDFKSHEFALQSLSTGSAWRPSFKESAELQTHQHEHHHHHHHSKGHHHHPQHQHHSDHHNHSEGHHGHSDQDQIRKLKHIHEALPPAMPTNQEPHGQELQIKIDESNLAPRAPLSSPSTALIEEKDHPASQIMSPRSLSPTKAEIKPNLTPRSLSQQWKLMLSAKSQPGLSPRSLSPMPGKSGPWQSLLLSSRMMNRSLPSPVAAAEAHQENAVLRSELETFQQLSEAREELAAERSARGADQVRLELVTLKQQLQEARKKEQEKESKRHSSKDSEKLVVECATKAKEIDGLRSEFALAERRAEDLEEHVAHSRRAHQQVVSTAEQDREATQLTRKELEDLRKQVEKSEKKLRDAETATRDQSARSELENAVAKEREKAENLRRENELQSMRSAHSISLKGWQKEHQTAEKIAETEEQSMQNLRHELIEVNSELHSVREESKKFRADGADEERALQKAIAEIDRLGGGLEHEAEKNKHLADEFSTLQLDKDCLETRNAELEQKSEDCVRCMAEEAGQLEEVRAELARALEQAELAQTLQQKEAEQLQKFELAEQQQQDERDELAEQQLQQRELGEPTFAVELGSTINTLQNNDPVSPSQVRDRDRLEQAIDRQNKEDLQHAIQVAEKAGVKGDLVEKARIKLALLRHTSVWSYEPAIFAKLRLKDGPDQNALKTPYSLVPEEVFQVSERVQQDDGPHFLRLTDGRGWAVEEDLENNCANCVEHRNLLVTGSQGMVACLWDLDGGMNEQAQEIAKEIARKAAEAAAAAKAAAKAKAKSKAKAKAKAEAAPTTTEEVPKPQEEEKPTKPTGKLLHRFLHLGKVNCVVADGQQLATGSADSFARVWDLGTGAELCRFRHGDSVWSVAISGRLLATGSADKFARIWDMDMESEGEMCRFQHDGEVRAVAFTNPGSGQVQLATGAADDKARLWSLETSQLTTEFLHDGWVLAVCFAGEQFVTGSVDRFVRFWSLGGEIIQKIEHPEGVNSVMWNGDMLATGCEDGYARLWKDGAEYTKIRHDGPVCSVFASGKTLVTAAVELPSSEKVARLWDCSGKGGDFIRQFPHIDQVRSVCVIST